LTNQGREFLREDFQILCGQDLIDYQSPSQDHMKMNRLGKKVVQMVKWGLKTYGLQKGHQYEPRDYLYFQQTIPTTLEVTWGKVILKIKVILSCKALILGGQD
jgi:hypothetical protein